MKWSSRSTGGFIGSAGIVTASNGVAHQRYQSVVAPLENVSLQAPSRAVYYNQERWLFRDSNWAADFPTTAALERFFYKLDFHHPAPNVIDITADGAAALLQGTGPIDVPEYKRWVNAGNVGELADYYAHWAPTVPTLSHWKAAQTDRRRQRRTHGASSSSRSWQRTSCSACSISPPGRSCRSARRSARP